MRIIGGEFKGRIIDIPKDEDVRPTSNKAREALFNIIRDRMRGSSVLDLFSGSGSLGIEALSWGASKAVFVDARRDCIGVISNNLKRLQIKPDSATVIRNDALKAIKKLSDTKMRFDLVFMDPPYYGDWIKKCLIYLNRYDILNHSSLIICEHFKKDIVPEEVGHLRKVCEKRYGDTVLSIYVNDGGDTSLSFREYA